MNVENGPHFGALAPNAPPPACPRAATLASAPRGPSFAGNTHLLVAGQRRGTARFGENARAGFPKRRRLDESDDVGQADRLATIIATMLAAQAPTPGVTNAKRSA